MGASERREQIQEILKQSRQPVSAGALALRLGVSRQVIVGDVALLRASNVPIAATPRGYTLHAERFPGGAEYTIACRHSEENMREELYTIVDNGCGVLDVTVDHAVYGQISGQLQIFSRFDVDDFMKKLSQSNAMPLSGLTGGVHLHTISCPSREAYERVLRALAEKGILLEKDE